jgi:hypothetical protein
MRAAQRRSSAAARRVREREPRRQSARACVKNRSNRAVGCSEGWAATGVRVARSDGERARGRRVRPYRRYAPAARNARARRAEWAHEMVDGEAAPPKRARASRSASPFPGASATASLSRMRRRGGRIGATRAAVILRPYFPSETRSGYRRWGSRWLGGDAQRRSSAGRPTSTGVWSSKIVGTRCDGKSQREGGRLQQVLGGAAGVTSFRSAHTCATPLAGQTHGQTRRYDSRAEP